MRQPRRGEWYLLHDQDVKHVQDDEHQAFPPQREKGGRLEQGKPAAAARCARHAGWGTAGCPVTFPDPGARPADEPPSPHLSCHLALTWQQRRLGWGLLNYRGFVGLRRSASSYLEKGGITSSRASLLAQLVKNLPAMQETLVQFLGQEDPLEKGYHSSINTHSSIPGGSDGKESTRNMGDMGSIPGLGRCPGEGKGNPLQYSCLENPYGQKSLGGYSSWGRKESDTTE